MKTLRLFSLLTAFSLCCGLVRATGLGFAQEDGGQPGSFLDYAASARSIAMGRAHTGVADDASAVYWNPAGLTQLDRKEIVSFYSMLHADTSFGSASYAAPTLHHGTFGFGFVNLRTDNITRRDNQGADLGNFHDNQMALLFSHGFNVSPRWSLGSTLKMIRQNIDVYSANGYGFDLGALYRVDSRIQMGLSLRNALAPRLTLRDDSETLARQYRVGFKFSPAGKWTTALDVAKNEHGAMKFLTGIEWKVSDVISLRAGLQESEMTTGIGFMHRDWGMDYALGYHDAAGGPSDLGISHRLGFHVRFGNGLAEELELTRLELRGRAIVAQLEHSLADGSTLSDADAAALTKELTAIIRREGISKPKDLFAAQAYIAYFQKEFDKSVPYFDEAVKVNAANAALKTNREKAQSARLKARTDEIVAQEIKSKDEALAAGNLRLAAQSMRKILQLRPDDTETASALTDIETKIQTPITLTMNEAMEHFKKGDYLEAIRVFTQVKEMDPENKEVGLYIPEAIGALEKQASAQAAQTSKQEPVYQAERNAKKSVTLYSQGLLSYSQGKVQEAGSLWKQALAQDPQNILAKNAYNRVMREMKANNQTPAGQAYFVEFEKEPSDR